MDLQKWQHTIDWLKDSPFVIGFFGSITVLFFEAKLSVWRAFFLLFIGTVSAGFLAPWLADLLGFDSPNAAAAMAFIVGTLAQWLIGGLLKLGEQFRSDPLGLFRKIYSLRKP